MPPFTPPENVASAARRGLRLRDKFGRGGTAVGVARARDLSNRRPVSLETIGRMVSFFARHGAQRPNDVGDDSDPSPWLVAWLLWGGDPGREWANSKWERYKDRRSEMHFAGLNIALFSERDRRGAMLPVPEGYTVGRPFATLRTGPCRSRFSGEEIGPTVTRENLEDMLRLLLERSSQDPVVIDWNHGSSPSFSASEDPHKGGSLGLIVGGWIEPLEGGGSELVVIPAYNARGVDVVEQNRGALWNSPEFVVGKVYARESEDATEIGSGQLLAVALTNRPAQVATTAEPVTLTEGDRAQEDATMAKITATEAPEEPIAAAEDEPALVPEEEQAEMMEGYISIEEHQAALAAKDEEIAALRAKLEEMAGGEDERTEVVAASERLASEVRKLREDLNHERGLREAAEDEAHFQALFAEGKCAPAEKETLVRALGEKRAGRPWMYDALFAAREPNSSVDFAEHGHSHRAEPEPEMTQEQRFHRDLRAYAEKQGITNIQDALKGYIRDHKED